MYLFSLLSFHCKEPYAKLICAIVPVNYRCHQAWLDLGFKPPKVDGIAHRGLLQP